MKTLTVDPSQEAPQQQDIPHHVCAQAKVRYHTQCSQQKRHSFERSLIQIIGAAFRQRRRPEAS